MNLAKLAGKVNRTLVSTLGDELAFAVAKALPWLVSAFFTVSVIYFFTFGIALRDARLLTVSFLLLLIQFGFTLVATKYLRLQKIFSKSIQDYGALVSVFISILFGAATMFYSWKLALVWLGISVVWFAQTRRTRKTIFVSHQELRRIGSNSQLNANGISIVMPYFNQSDYVKDAVASVQAQTYKNWEIIIVDDQSTDANLGELYELTQRDKRVRLIRLRENVGLPGARNAGAMVAKGKYLIFLDADDALLPTALERRVALLSRSSDAWGAGAKTRQVQEDCDWRTVQVHESIERVEKISLASTLFNSPFAVHEIMLRSSIFRLLGGFREDLRNGAEDADFWLRAFQAGGRFYRSETVDSIYRQHPTSMISKNILNQAKETISVIKKAWEVGAAEFNNTLLQQSTQIRLFQFLGMSLIENDQEHLKEIVDLLEAEESNAVPVEIAKNEIQKGLKRAALRRSIDIEKSHPELQNAVNEYAEKFGTQPFAKLKNFQESNHSDTLILVENAAQLKSMHQALEENEGRSVPTLLLCSPFEGNQGATKLLEELEISYPTISLTEYQLSGMCFGHVKVFEPVSWLAERIMAQAISEGSSLSTIHCEWSNGIAVTDDDYLESRNFSFLETVPSIPVSSLRSALTTNSQTRHTLRNPFEVWPLVGVNNHGVQGDYNGLESPDYDKLQNLKNKYAGKKCIIIGNGPSLNKIDFNLFSKAPTFGVNSIFLAKDRLPEPISFYVVEDTKVFEENTEQILEFSRSCDLTLLPTLYKDSVKDKEQAIFFRMNGSFYRKEDPYYGLPRFSVAADEVTFCGQSVTMQNLQLAFWMGFSEVALVGMDFSYTIPKETEIQGHHYHSQGDDPNHFDKSYFGAGKTWKDPKLNRVAANYEMARIIFEAFDRKIINCTVGGNLEIFERMTLEEFLGE